MTRPLVSVLVNTYNHERFIAQAIQSVLNQDFPSEQMEIIVVDDGSADCTPEVIRAFLPRIRYIRKENGGQISAFNVGVAEARSDVIAFLDGDDWWAKEKLKTVLEVFEKEPAAMAVGHGFIEFYQQTGAELACLPGSDYHLHLTAPTAARFAHSGRRFLATSKLSVRRMVLDKLGRLPDDLVFFDGPVTLFALALGPAVVLNKALAFYRIHGQNLYESQDSDPQVLRRKCQIIDAQRRFLPPLMASVAVSREAISAVLEPQELDRERMRIDLEGGWPWETFRLEVRRFRASYEQRSLPYVIFKWLALLPALFMPPRRFYRLRDWYSTSNLREFRKILGEPKPVPEIDIRKFDH